MRTPLPTCHPVPPRTPSTGPDHAKSDASSTDSARRPRPHRAPRATRPTHRRRTLWIFRSESLPNARHVHAPPSPSTPSTTDPSSRPIRGQLRRPWLGSDVTAGFEGGARGESEAAHLVCGGHGKGGQQWRQHSRKRVCAWRHARTCSQPARHCAVAAAEEWLHTTRDQHAPAECGHPALPRPALHSLQPHQRPWRHTPCSAEATQPPSQRRVRPTAWAPATHLQRWRARDWRPCGTACSWRAVRVPVPPTHSCPVWHDRTSCSTELTQTRNKIL